MVSAENSEPTGINVISDNKNVLALLLHFYHEFDIKMMESPTKCKLSVDIGKTMEKHADTQTSSQKYF
jgi:hypothetical protein